VTIQHTTTGSNRSRGLFILATLRAKANFAAAAAGSGKYFRKSINASAYRSCSNDCFSGGGAQMKSYYPNHTIVLSSATDENLREAIESSSETNRHQSLSRFDSIHKHTQWYRVRYTPKRRTKKGRQKKHESKVRLQKNRTFFTWE
jgi:hypothetical protein